MHKIIHNDCHKEIVNIESESVDLIASDPPYEIEYGKEEWDKKGIKENS